MNIFRNLELLTAKNKHFILAALVFLIGITNKTESKNKEFDYLGDNVPLALVERIRNI